MDLARQLPVVEAVVLTDAALHRRAVSLALLTDWIERHPGFWGIARVRDVANFAEPASESPMETRLRMALVLAGLPRPQVQVTLRNARGAFIGRPDLYYRLERVAIEYDGLTHKDSLAADDRRQNRFVNAGIRLLRFTAADVLGAPGPLVALVQAALAA